MAIISLLCNKYTYDTSNLVLMLLFPARRNQRFFKGSSKLSNIKVPIYCVHDVDKEVFKYILSDSEELRHLNTTAMNFE